MKNIFGHANGIFYQMVALDIKLSHLTSSYAGLGCVYQISGQSIK